MKSYSYNAFFLMLLVTACGGGSNTDSPTSADNSPEPEASNTVIRLFSKPFSGDYPSTNPFDHFYPSYPTNDDNTAFVDYRGLDLDQNFGWDGHNGHDWVMPEGTPLLSVADGTVEFVGSEPCNWANANGDTLLLRVRHDPINGEIFDSIYAHVSEFSVEVGDRVQRGQQIALSGNTGCSTGPHLHFVTLRITNTNDSTATVIDPFGWQGDETDPWEYHTEGAQSVWLWLSGEAPLPYGFGVDSD